VARHIGHVGTGCGPASGPLRLEARIEERVFRVSNPTVAPITFYYDWAPSFGDYQMFFVRFLNGVGDFAGSRDGNCGWWSAKENDATMWVPGEWPRRRTLTIAAGGHVDIPIDQEALTYWWPYSHRGAETGPCTMQVRLFGYLSPRTWEGISAEAEWLPVPCPPSELTTNPWLGQRPRPGPS
jgi:hypothetical protein